MNVVLEEVSPCQKRMKIEVPVNVVNDELERVTQDFQKQAKVSGFRQGKIPRSVVEKRFSQEIEEEMKRTIVPRVFRDAVKTKNLKVISTPQVEDLQYQRGVSLSFSTLVDLAPEFVLPNYKSFRVTDRTAEPVTDEKVQETINRMLMQFASYETVEGRAAQDDDFTVIEYVGKLDGQPLKDIIKAIPSICENKDYWLWLKPDSFVPGFVDQVIGMTPGTEKDITINFPADYGHADLQNKTVVYHVKLIEIKQRILPTLDDAFSQEHFKMPVEEVQKLVRTDLERQATQTLRNKQSQELMSKLKEAVSFDLPESLVQRETQRLIYDIVRENQSRRVPESLIEEKKSEIFATASEQARSRVKLGFIISRIAEAEKIEVTQQELGSQIGMMARQYQMDPKKLVEQLDKNNSFGEVENQILNQKTIDFLLESATKE